MRQWTVVPSSTEIVESLFDPRFRVWDREVLDHMYQHVWDPEIEWRAIEGAPDDVGVMRGRDRVRRYYEEWQELFEEISVEAREVVEVGDSVVAVQRAAGRSRSSGVETTIDYAVVYTLKDGRIASGREYATRDEAVAAAHSLARTRA